MRTRSISDEFILYCDLHRDLPCDLYPNLGPDLYLILFREPKF